MENLNAEQVKKALACCNTIGGCKVCPYSCNGKPTDNGECGEKMSLDALALINKQETEYNELYELLQTYKADSEAYRSYSKTLEKENETLKTLLDESFEAQNTVKADTVRKMQERLKEVSHMTYNINSVEIEGVVYVSEIDQIAKEMLEGENEN